HGTIHCGINSTAGLRTLITRIASSDRMFGSFRSWRAAMDFCTVSSAIGSLAASQQGRVDGHLPFYRDLVPGVIDRRPVLERIGPFSSPGSIRLVQGRALA